MTDAPSIPPADHLSYSTKPTDTDGMPGGIPFIIGNEAAERFSFYGMKCILTIFMVDYLQWMGSSETVAMSNAEATEHYHSFTAAAYFFPVLGALLSDVFLGKYRTILYLSIVYCIGHAALAMMGAPPMGASMWLFVGLFLISVGSGGIKPCVSAHVGDQFGERNKDLLTKVYQWFYFSINFGSFISTLLTPWVLENYGPHWAFGIPGVLMAFATLLFWMGRNRFVHIPPGGMKFLKETFSWTGISTILKLFCIFSFVAVFWALFDQTGSSWVLQAKSLNRNWMGIEWLESQIQAINPIMVLALIPVFQFGIYPALNTVFEMTPIRKISIGLFVMAGGFSIVSIVQQWIDAGGEPSISWQFLAYAILTASEVMVSITCLEFAYTQAPKTMKSVVMALFLLSVSLGNVFTAGVNRYIQTPSVLAAAEGLDASSFQPGESLSMSGFDALVDDQSTLTILGPDGKSGTEDDATLTFNDDGAVDAVTNSSEAAFAEAAQVIEDKFFAGQGGQVESELPSDADGNELIAGKTDGFGNPIRYKTLSRDRFLLVSMGADQVDGSRWDQTLTSIVSRAENKTESQDPNYFSWLERRKIEIEAGTDPEKIASVQQRLREERGGGEETKFKRSYAIGGRVLLEGAAYFWFWTKCIFVTACLFIPVGYFYKEKTYIQGDEDVEGYEPEAEATA
ncbi:POT family MFS transporter [Stieleria tagensis]|uniref:POT family MFS transporter n=1 Tax=Stieleria tagensis TaxID=2956795 RepID=UPI0036F37B97